METMRHTFRPAIPASSIAIVSLFALGLLLGSDDSLPIAAAGRYFFLILAPLALLHLHRIAVSLQFLELSPEGLTAHGLFRLRLFRFIDLESARFSQLTGHFVVRTSSARLSIPATCQRFGELHTAILIGLWAHRPQQSAETAAETVAQPIGVLRPSFAERAHAAYAVSAPIVWAGSLSWAAGLNSPALLSMLFVGGALQTAMNFHSLSHLLNWYEIRADGLVIHSLCSRQFLPACAFLTSLVREDRQGRGLELAFLKETIRLRFIFPLPAEDLAGMLNQRWTAQVSY